MTSLEAVFDGEVFRPTSRPDIAPNTTCRITVVIPDSETGAAGDAWDILEQLAGTVEAPADWSEEHDHYIHGNPKRNAGGGA